MNTFAVEIWDDTGSKCCLYTVRDMELADSETDRFFARFVADNAPHQDKAQDLLQLLIGAIATKYGATNDFINRTKKHAHALPPKPSYAPEEIKILGTNFPLRLYCYRVNESILILFNGGVKTANTDQKSPDLSMKFHDTQQYVLAIAEAIKDGTVIVSNNRLQTLEENNEIILLR